MNKRLKQGKSNVRDVAKLAGVSVATVSRVMNMPGVVSGGTREKVEQAIETLQFVPSSSARAINSGRTRLVGALIPTLDHSIYSRFMEKIEVGLDDAGLSLIVATTDYDAHKELEKTKRLLNLGVEALVVSGSVRAEGFAELTRRHQMPVIATSRFDPHLDMPSIGYDNFQVGRDAAQHLISLGHKQIVVMSGPILTNDRTRARLDGVLSTVENLASVHEAELDFSSAAVAAAEILRDQPNATAILCLSDVLAQGTLLYLSKVGIGVPEDISVIGIDDLPSSASFNPPLTSVHLPVGQMGKEVAIALSDWIENGVKPESKKLSAGVVERGSTRPI